MADEGLHDLHLNGIGKVGGGRFNRVKIDGVGEVSGDVHCNVFTCNGKGTVKGNIIAEELQIQGMCKVKGNLRAHRLIVNGSSTIEGNIHAEHIEVNGSVKADGNCKAESVVIKGKVDLFGILNAESTRIELVGKSRAREISGIEIEVKLNNEKQEVVNKLLSSVFGASQLMTESIEGERIRLEHTKVNVVRGSSISIGPGCEVSRIEYKQELYMDPSSSVKEVVKIL